MKIGIVVDNEFNNDIRVRNEALALQNAGHDVFVLCFEFGSQLGNNYKGIKINRWNLKPKYKNILFAFFHFINLYSFLWSKKIQAFIKSNEIEVIHVHDLYMAKAGYLAKKKCSIPMVLDLHENYPYAVDDYQWMHKSPQSIIIQAGKWKKIEGKYLSFADKIVVLSQTFKDILVKKYSNLTESSFIIYPNVPDVPKLSSYNINKDIIKKNNDFVLFYFGGISKRRGVYIAIESIKQIKDKIPNIKLLLIGPVDKAEQKAFNQLIEDKEVRSHIIFYPWKDISLLPSYITYSDICLSPIEKNPQHESGIANKVFQYMLFKRAVLVSDCGPQAEVINQSKCGLVHQWNSVEDFSKKVEWLYTHKKERIEMGENGYNSVIEKYNQKSLIKPLLEFYK
jgi:glycosyltransferase involved in cell wall biosynthesis